MMDSYDGAGALLRGAAIARVRFCAGPLLRGSAIARPKNISSIRSGIVAKVTGPTEQPFRGGVTDFLENLLSVVLVLSHWRVSYGRTITIMTFFIQHMYTGNSSLKTQTHTIYTDLKKYKQSCGFLVM